MLKDQVCLLLKELYAFKLSEIVEIMDLSIDQVKHSLVASRKKQEVIFEKRFALINKKGMCHQCSELMGMLNPRQKAEEEIMKLKLVKERDTKDYIKLLELRMKLVKSIDPIHTEGFDLHNYMLEKLPEHSDLNMM